MDENELHPGYDVSIKPNDIVQIIDKKHDWFTCLIIVADLKPFGIIGYCLVPEGSERVRKAYIRLTEGTYKKVGSASIQIY